MHLPKKLNFLYNYKQNKLATKKANTSCLYMDKLQSLSQLELGAGPAVLEHQPQVNKSAVKQTPSCKQQNKLISALLLGEKSLTITQMKNAFQNANWGNISGQPELPFAILMALPMVKYKVTITINLRTAYTEDDQQYYMINNKLPY